MGQKRKAKRAAVKRIKRSARELLQQQAPSGLRGTRVARVERIADLKPGAPLTAKMLLAQIAALMEHKP